MSLIVKKNILVYVYNPSKWTVHLFNTKNEWNDFNSYSYNSNIVVTFILENQFFIGLFYCLLYVIFRIWYLNIEFYLIIHEYTGNVKSNFSAIFWLQIIVYILITLFSTQNVFGLRIKSNYFKIKFSFITLIDISCAICFLNVCTFLL